MAETQEPTKTYRANCHCGDLVYEIDLPAEINKATECNCSVCSKKGYVWHFANDTYKVVKGAQEDLSVYTWGAGNVKHYVSKTSSGFVPKEGCQG
jgi:hypothetical protein